MVETPVLYITFARPEYASQSFAAIKKAQPKKLYFYSNKARDEKPDEVARNLEVRSYINLIDWDCEVITWFREEYVDVFTSIWGAIDWAFKNEEKAIIIEEDVVASLAFFDYVDKSIIEFASNNKVWLISGNNGAEKFFPNGFDCGLTRWADIYGWASWRDRWNSVDWSLSTWPAVLKNGQLRCYWKSLFIHSYMYLFYKHFYKKATSTDYKPWDSIFLFSMRSNNGYCITPKENLCQDIGVIGANHKQNQQSHLSQTSINTEKLNLRFVASEDCTKEFDAKYFMHIMFPAFIKRKLSGFLKY